MSRIAAVVVLVAALVTQAFALTEDFSSNPFGNWSFGVGDNSNSQFTWNSAAPAVYTGDAVGSLSVHLDSSLPTARFQRPLGATVTDTDSFTLKTRFSFDVTSAGSSDFMQLAFGLVNSSLTGGNRTGTMPSFGDATTFHTVEFNYFPNVSTFGGPTLSPAVFGAQKGGSDAFGNFAAYFLSEADLGDNTIGVTALPQSVTLEASLNYNGATKSLALTMNRVEPDGSLTPLNIEQPPLSLTTLPPFANYDAGFPFAVDALAIMAYRDAADFVPASVSLVADLTFQQFEFATALVPEPGLAGLLVLGSASVFFWRQRRR